MTQETATPNELAHYGVKGMKWGVKKADPNDNPSPKYSVQQRRKDLRDHGKRGVKRINRRLNKGQTLKKARGRETLRNTLQSASVVGALYAANFVRLAGPMVMQSIAVRAQTKRGEAALADSMGLPREGSSINYSKQKRDGVYNISSL
jgi:hypothetical protein